MAFDVKALVFDVFGTLVDWRNSIAREAETLFKPKGIALDYGGFADAWRGEYQGALEEVRAERIPFCKLDILHRRNLELTLKRFAVDGLGEQDKRELNMASMSGACEAQRPRCAAGLAARPLVQVGSPTRVRQERDNW